MKCVCLFYVFKKFTLIRSKWNVGPFMGCSIILSISLNTASSFSAAAIAVELFFCSILNFINVRLYSLCERCMWFHFPHTALTSYVTNCVFPHAVRRLHHTGCTHYIFYLHATFFIGIISTYTHIFPIHLTFDGSSWCAVAESSPFFCSSSTSSHFALPHIKLNDVTYDILNQYHRRFPRKGIIISLKQI